MAFVQKPPTPAETRFKGAMSEEYKLLELALPHFQLLQRRVAEHVAAFKPEAPRRLLDGVEIGCGSGVTTFAILTSRPDVHVRAVDSEEEMISQARGNLDSFLREGRCEVILADAASYLEGLAPASVDVVASALTLHNLERTHRSRVHAAIRRVLRPGGLFVNADKYAEDGAQRFRALDIALGRFFDALVPIGKLNLLRAWVLHNVADQSPERVMKETETIEELRRLGFREITVADRHNMEAVLVARAQRIPDSTA